MDFSRNDMPKDADVIDENPQAYKPTTDVMNAQRDLVEIV